MKILMLCMGNICRSPLAEGILRSKLPENYSIDSAGIISFHEGKKADPRAIKTAKKHGIDIEGHRARQIKPSDLQEFDKIYCMDLDNYEGAVSMAKSEEERRKISLLLEEAGNFGENIEVPDPYYGDMEEFEEVFGMLDKACSVVATKYLGTV